MLNIIATILISVITSLGVISFNPISIWDKPSNLLGTASFPTSVATLTNPNSTDSVATVSHSSQHANANDEIEAIEAKVGTGASTATNGTLLYGNGTGSSIWSASPSITGLTLSGQGIFGSFISNASSTVVGNLNITGNATTTSATSTNLFSTNAQFTNLNGTNFNGFSLTPCSGGNFLQWSGGVFSCDSPGTTVMISTTTTTGTWYATTTITGISANKILDVSIYVGTTTLSQASDVGVNIGFNDSILDDIARTSSQDGGARSALTTKYINLVSGGTNHHPTYINLTIDNLTGHYRTGTFQYTVTENQMTFPDTDSVTYGSFSWATTTPITSISFSLQSRTDKVSSSTINVFQK